MNLTTVEETYRWTDDFGSADELKTPDHFSNDQNSPPGDVQINEENK